MAKKQFNYFYKKYDTIRSIIRRMYLYGCYSREDYKDLVCVRKFDNELKRIKLILNDHNVVQTYKGKSKYTVVNYDYFEESENILVDSFYAKAFKENEFKLYFLIMQVMNDAPANGYTVNDVEELCGENIQNIDRATLRNHLEKMVEEGYLEYKNISNRKRYYLTEDIFSEFDYSELNEIVTAISFYKNTSILNIAGYYLYDSIKRYVKDKFCDEMKLDFFIFRHNYLHQILDEEVIYEILKAMNESNILTFRYNALVLNNITPIEIISEGYYGRQYLLGFDFEKNTFSVFRIDKIYDIAQGKQNISFKTDILKDSWCISVKNTKPQKVEIKFEFDDNTELHLIRRLIREKKHGHINIDNNTYLYTIYVSDPIEMMPWIRTFYGNIKEINNDELICYVNEDLIMMAGVYESF